MSKPKIHFHEGIPTVEKLYKWFRPTGGGLLVMDECGNDKMVMGIFTKHSHHRNISVIYITQDLFPNGKFAKTISQNDLMDECRNDKTVMDIFTKHSHHRNISVIYITQDLFPNGKFAMTISRNVHYIVAFKNPCDKVGVRTVVQAFPKQWKDVMTVFQKATSKPYGYLAMDFHSETPDDHRLWTDILKDKGTYPRLYKSKKIA